MELLPIFRFGVAGGVAEYFDIEPNLVRVGFVVLGVCSLLVAVVAYLGLAVVMPSPSIAAEPSDSVASLNELRHAFSITKHVWEHSDISQIFAAADGIDQFTMDRVWAFNITN